MGFRWPRAKHLSNIEDFLENNLLQISLPKTHPQKLKKRNCQKRNAHIKLAKKRKHNCQNKPKNCPIIIIRKKKEKKTILQLDTWHREQMKPSLPFKKKGTFRSSSSVSGFKGRPFPGLLAVAVTRTFSCASSESVDNPETKSSMLLDRSFPCCSTNSNCSRKGVTHSTSCANSSKSTCPLWSASK